MTSRRTLAEMMREEMTPDGAAEVMRLRCLIADVTPIPADEEREALAVLDAMRRKEAPR